MKFTQEELKELILTLMLGSWVREVVDDHKGKEYKHPSAYEQQVQYFLETAEKLGYEELFEKFKGELIPSEMLGEKELEIMEVFHDNTFWEELITRMGKRDFYKEMTPEEKGQIEKTSWLPDRIQGFYDTFRKEFEKHGIDRLQIADEPKE